MLSAVMVLGHLPSFIILVHAQQTSDLTVTGSGGAFGVEKSNCNDCPYNSHYGKSHLAT